MAPSKDQLIDWPKVYGGWLSSKHINPDLTLAEYTREAGVNYSYASTMFKKIRDDRIREGMTKILEKGVNIINKTLDAKEVNPDFALKATVSMADRVGFAPNVNQINVQNNVGVNISLVSKEDSVDIKQMLGGVDNVQSDSDLGRDESAGSVVDE